MDTDRYTCVYTQLRRQMPSTIYGKIYPSSFISQATSVRAPYVWCSFWAFCAAPLLYLSTNVLITTIYYKYWHLVEQVFSPLTFSYVSSPFLTLCTYKHILESFKFYWNKTEQSTLLRFLLEVHHSSSKLSLFSNPYSWYISK